MDYTKYIKTKNDEIITFSQLLQHSEFKNFEPKSAGFISIGKDKDGKVSCECFGESFSLDLNSDYEDTNLAKIQILNYEAYEL